MRVNFHTICRLQGATHGSDPVRDDLQTNPESFLLLHDVNILVLLYQSSS